MSRRLWAEADRCHYQAAAIASRMGPNENGALGCSFLFLFFFSSSFCSERAFAREMNSAKKTRHTQEMAPK